MAKNLRNVGIVLLLAALVAFVPGGDALSRTLILAISLAFLAGIGFLAYRLYRDQQLMLAGLSDMRRAVLYGAVGLIALLIAGYQAFSGFGGGLLVWLALLLASAGAIFWVVREANSYG
jgi:hypothetical protein